MAVGVNTLIRQTIPGPPGQFLFGNMRQAREDPIGIYMRGRAQYGDVVRLRSIGKMFWVFLAHPDDVEYVLRKNQHNYPKGLFETRLKLLVGEGLLTSSGSFWLRQRRLVQPAFHRHRLATLGTTMTDAAEALVERWQPRAATGQPFNVAAEMMRLTLQIVARALFSTDVSADAGTVGQALTVALEHINYRMTHFFSLPERFPTLRNLRFRRAVRRLDAVALRIIEERRRSGEDMGDLLSMLLLARDEETGEGMSDAQLRDEVMTILLAGHETTAVALSWTWYLLACHQQIERKLHAELDEVLGGRTPRVEDLPDLPYTRMVIDEALRLYPPAWFTGRQAKDEDEIRGYCIPAGTPIALSQYVTHRHPAFWERPEAFEPERFTPERSAGRPHFAYFPFGGGPRQCIGNNFALMEARLVLATIARRYRLRLVPGQRIVPEPLVTLRPHNGIRMRLEERR